MSAFLKKNLLLLAIFCIQQPQKQKKNIFLKILF